MCLSPVGARRVLSALLAASHGLNLSGTISWMSLVFVSLRGEGPSSESWLAHR